MSDNFTIRLFEPRDAQNFCALNLQLLRESIPAGEPYNAANLAQHQQDIFQTFGTFDPHRSTILVADVGGRYAGHCWIGTQTDYFTKSVEPWIFDISVAEPFRRRGLGTAMIQAAEEFVRSRGFKGIGLQVMDHNKAAARMYLNRGYKPKSHTLRKPL